MEFDKHDSKISHAQKIKKMAPMVMLMASFRRRFIREVDALAAANPTMKSLQRKTWTIRMHDVYNVFYFSNNHDEAVRHVPFHSTTQSFF